MLNVNTVRSKFSSSGFAAAAGLDAASGTFCAGACFASVESGFDDEKNIL